MLERCSRRKESLNSRAAPATTDLRMHPQYSRIDESFLLDDCAGLRIEVTRIVKRRAISGRRRMSGTRAFKKLVNSDQTNGAGRALALTEINGTRAKERWGSLLNFRKVKEHVQSWGGGEIEWSPPGYCSIPKPGKESIKGQNGPSAWMINESTERSELHR